MCIAPQPFATFINPKHIKTLSTTMISPLAYVDPKAVIGQNVTIHPFAYVDADTTIGDNCEILPYATGV